jgi:hypothetical protein
MANTNSDLDKAIKAIDAVMRGGPGKKPSEFDKSKTSLAGFSGGGGGLFSNYNTEYKRVVFMDASITKKKSEWPTFNNNVVWEYIVNGAMYNAFKAGGLYNKDSKKKCDTNCYEEMNTVVTTVGGVVEKTDNKTLKDLLDPATVGRSVCGTHCNVPTYMVSKWFS